MKLRFIATAKGRDWKVGDTADFNDRDSCAMSYARKYIERGWAEEIPSSAQRGGAAVADKPGEKPADTKAGEASK